MKKNLKGKKTLFAGLALVALAGVVTTTFAAFVITGGDNSADGNVSVVGEDVRNDTLNVEFALTDGSITLGPNTTDSSKRVHGDSVTEDLSVAASLTVTGTADVWDTVTITATIPEALQNYVAFDTVTLSVSDFAAGENNTYTLNSDKQTFNFKWGPAFKGSNPCDYYSDGAGKDVSASEVETALKEMKDAVNDQTITLTAAASKA